MNHNKICKICKKEFVTTRSKKLTCGYDCQIEYNKIFSKIWIEKNKESRRQYHKEYMKNWRKNNKNKIKHTAKKYYIKKKKNIKNKYKVKTYKLKNKDKLDSMKNLKSFFDDFINYNHFSYAEQVIFLYKIQGLKNYEISNILNIKKKTVGAHYSNILKKAKIKNKKTSQLCFNAFSFSIRNHFDYNLKDINYNILPTGMIKKLSD